MARRIGKYKVSDRVWEINQHDEANSTPSSLTVGGGYGDTGVTISAAGVIQGNGAGTIDGLVTGGVGFTATTGNLTATDGNIVITAADHGIIHTNSGTVTQATNITTGVTLNTTSGVITMHATAITADENIEFTVTNSTVQADSVILLTMQDENTVDNTQLVCATHTIAGGSFKITVANTDSAQDSSATANKIHFLVINNS